jgi:hypothetical protein
LEKFTSALCYLKYVYDCAEKICSAYVAESIQSSCMSYEYAEKNIKINIEEIDLMIVRSEKIDKYIILILLLLSTLFGRNGEYLAQLIQV